MEGEPRNGVAGSTIESAAEHASAAVPRAAPTDRAGAVRDALQGRTFACASHIVVCEGGTFAGLVTIEALLAAPDDAPIGSVMDREPPVVQPGVDQEVAAWQAVRRNESALCVVDAGGRFVGLIPPQRLLAVLLAEHEEDLSRIGGFTRSTSRIRTASEEPVQRRVRHRLPWLIVGLAGALAAADIVGWFETQLQRNVMLAFFLPGIVYLADAVGTQTETIAVRGLSVGVAMRRMAPRELLAGVAIGLALAVVAGPVIWWRWGDGFLAASVALAIFGACSTATLAALLLPWCFDLLGADPAFGSGPLATLLQDLLSIVIYFGIVAALVS